MNILLLFPGGVTPGGEEKIIPALLALMKELSRLHQVTVLLQRQDRQLREFTLHGCQVISLPYACAWGSLALYAKQVKLAVGRLKFYRVIPEVIHSFWLGGPSVLAGLLGLIYRAPLVATLAGGEAVSLPGIGYGGSRHWRSRLVNRLSLALADELTCGSRYVKEIAGLRWRKSFSLIPLPVDNALWSLVRVEEKDLMPKRKWQFVHLASINRVKNPRLLLALAAELVRRKCEFHLHWVGEDTLDDEMQRSARESGLSSYISFYGFQTQAQLKPLMQEQDLIIQTSTFESQGIAMAEAASQGVCPVGTNVGWLHDLGLGISTSVDMGESQVHHLADEILLLCREPKLRLERINKAQSWLMAHRADIVAGQFLAKYRELTSY